MNERLANRRASNEDGVALLVVLVLVLVSTLLGVSAMQSSGIETRLVANEAYRQSVFRASESVSERALAGIDAGSLPATEIAAVASQVVDDRVEVITDARLEGIEHQLNTSTGLFQNRLYRVTSTATIRNLDARRTVVQGAARRTPALGR